MINGASHFGFTNLFKKWAKKNKIIPWWGTVVDVGKNSATITISLDGKGTVFPAKLKLQGDLFG